MRCHICDKDLSEKEVIYNEDLKAYEPCTTCLDIALDAAYSDGYKTEDDEFVLLDSSFDLNTEGDLVPRNHEALPDE